MYQKFQQLIDKKGLTIYRVAKDTKISTGTFYDWKAGRTNPKLDKLQKIATYLGVSLEELI
ncbi:MAG TPA: helix-turn-helix transcriptional regulator [Mobilitalea sp.]|nr:helix-turn-helix transcriptional regulator [Mobilitalea sp.]